jgi:hypothetical protein
MHVVIIEISTEKVVYNAYVNLKHIDKTPVSEEHYFNEAWRSAVEDNIVEMDAREKYKLRIAQM